MSEDKKNILKRPHEESSLIETQSSSDNDRQNKKAKGVPNWKNIKNQHSTVIRRYKDYEVAKIYDLCQGLIADRERKLLSKPIFSISINVLCKHKKDGSFIPIEIGIYSYKLRHGRNQQPYHVLINAGDLPSGHLSLATEHAKYHKITFPPKDKGYPVTARCDYAQIYKEMLNYIEPGERTVLIPHIKDMNQIRKSLEWLWEKASEQGFKLAKVSTWTLLPVKEYLHALHNWVQIDMLKFPEPSFCIGYYINMLLEADKYQYDDRIRCDYHRLEDNETEWCALSCAIRMINNVEKLLDEICDMYAYAIEPPAPPQQIHQSLTIQEPLAEIEGPAQHDGTGTICDEREVPRQITN